jgi:ketosteroid isomerase-like protein
MKKIVLLLLVPVLLVACVNKRPLQAIDPQGTLMNVDRAFSKMSEEEGVKKAFIKYIDSDGVLLRPNQYPIMGADAVDFISQNEDTTYTMTWEPKGGTVAQSGELGYTYGVYTLKLKKNNRVFQGTYVSVWKKQRDGQWRFVMDSGNEGVGK